MILPSRMEHTYSSYLAAMPEILEDGSSSTGSEHSSDTTKPVPLNQTSYLPTFFPQSHVHRESTSTSASDSAGSSPTTSASIADDSSVTEMSPGSSPESPMSKTGLPVMAMDSSRPRTSEEKRTSSQTAPFFELQRPLTPGKRPRNLKNLAVNTTATSNGPRASNPVLAEVDNTATAAQAPDIEASKPRAKSPPRKKPSNLSLTIMTPATNTAFPRGLLASIVPPTPSFTRPELRHFQSSPSLPSFPKSELSGGFPSISIATRPTLLRSRSEQVKLNDDDEQNFDIPQSREDKPEAYPLGPICVFEPYLDLYLEPTAHQAREYDVILNVASEVRNPFLQVDVPIAPDGDIRLDGGGGIQYAPRREEDSSHANGPTALPAVQEAPSPTTPKASPARGLSAAESLDVIDPEYVHIPWNHNTDIVPDLLRLVRLIDERVKRGKRVLVHCQCGVSRSATLVVAYCMYKNPAMSVQEAYDIVKAKSRWIGPNMNLIMQLQEFRSTLTGSSTTRRHLGFKSLTPVEASSNWNEWRRSDGGLGSGAGSKTPKTAPLPAWNAGSHHLYVYESGSVTPGPSSAPSGLEWPGVENRKDARALSVPDKPATPESPPEARPSLPTLNLPKEKRRPQSLRFEAGGNTVNSEAVRAPQPSPRAQEFAMTALQPSAEVAPDDRFGLMSPTTQEFNHSPLDRDVLLGSLGMGSALHEDSSRKRPQNFSYPHMRSAAPPQPLPIRSRQTSEDSLVPQITTEPRTTIINVTGPATEGEAGGDALLSPRASEFTSNPFEIALASTTNEAQSSLQTKVSTDDPRSPAQKGASPIVRNIANFLQ